MYVITSMVSSASTNSLSFHLGTTIELFGYRFEYMDTLAVYVLILL